MFFIVLALLALCFAAVGEAAVVQGSSMLAGFAVGGEGALRGGLCYGMGVILNVSDSYGPWEEMSGNWFVGLICTVASSLSMVAGFKLACEVARLNEARRSSSVKTGRLGADKRGSALSSSLIPDMVQTIYFQVQFLWYSDVNDIDTGLEFAYIAGISGCADVISHNIFHLLNVLHTAAVETRRLLELGTDLVQRSQLQAFESLYRMLMLFGLKVGRLLFPRVYMVSHDPLPLLSLSVFLGGLGRSSWQMKKYAPLAAMSLISVCFSGFNLCLQIVKGEIAAALVDIGSKRVYVSERGLSVGYVMWRVFVFLKVTQKTLSCGVERLLLKDRPTTVFSMFLKSVTEVVHEATRTTLPTLKMRKVKVAVCQGLVRSKPAVERWLSGQFSVFFRTAWQERVHAGSR